MRYDDFTPVQTYCQNCGTHCIGYKSRDGTTRILCGRCGAKMVSRKIDRRTVDTRMTAPQGQEIM